MVLIMLVAHDRFVLQEHFVETKVITKFGVPDFEISNAG